MFKNLFKKTISGTKWFDSIVWSFQGSYINTQLTLVNFLVLKIYWKIVSGTV